VAFGYYQDAFSQGSLMFLSASMLCIDSVPLFAE